MEDTQAEAAGGALPNFQEWISVMEVKAGGDEASIEMWGTELAERAEYRLLEGVTTVEESISCMRATFMRAVRSS